MIHCACNEPLSLSFHSQDENRYDNNINGHLDYAHQNKMQQLDNRKVLHKDQLVI